MAVIAGQETRDISIGLKDALEAQDPDTFQKALHRIAATIYHEIEHLVYPGTEIREESIEGSLAYLANPGEMRAHAKQFAYLYSQAFPGQVFDISKMISISTTVKEMHYFVTMANPEKQHQYASVADLKSVHEKMIELVSDFIAFM